MRGARVLDDTGERQVRRKKTVVEAKTPAPQTGVHARSKLEHARLAIGDPEPHDARPAAFRKPPSAIERQQERGDARGGIPRSGGHVVEPVIRRLAEEGEGEMEVFGFHAAQRRERGRQDLVCARCEVRRQRYRQEEAHASDGTAVFS